jgi:peptidoglycan/LPS O-acetylase OafA/YrhL
MESYSVSVSFPRERSRCRLICEERARYGLYLFTAPIFFIGEGYSLHLPFYLYDLALVGLGFAAAALSYEFVEKPCLRLKSRVGQRVALPAAAPAE